MVEIMDKFFHRHSLYIAVILFIFSVILFNNQVAAFGRPATIAEPNHEAFRPTGSISPEPGASSSGAQGEETNHISAFAKGQLQGGKLQACERIEKTLTMRSTHLVRLVTNMEKVFTSIAQGVEQYYLTKVVPTGASLTSYDSLVADIATKQSALTPLVAAAQSDVTTFSCTGTNPGASMTQYRTDMQAVIQGLKAYRTAIKNLIVAVRTLPSINPTAEPSETPKQNVTPTPTITTAPTVTPTPTIEPIVTP